MGLCMLNDRMEYKSRICLEFTIAYNYMFIVLFERTLKIIE